MSGCWQSTNQDIDLREGILRAKVFGVIFGCFYIGNRLGSF